MSDYLPLELQMEIMKKLPVKSLIQFRSVSKAWKALIDGSDFIKNYSSQQQHLLVRYDHLKHEEYVLIADDDTFPEKKESLTIPKLLNWFKDCHIIGSCHGLVCFYGNVGEENGGHSCRTAMSVLWNLSVRKAVAVVVPNVADGKLYETVLGFGVCRETTDPKIVKITYIKSEKDIERVSCIPWQVEVFTLSTGAWRRPYSTHLPRKSIEFHCDQVVIDGFLCWLVSDRINVDGGYGSYYLIISFNITSEEFRQVKLPDSLAHNGHLWCISKLRNSLVVLEQDVDADNPVYYVWMMENCVPESFTKLMTISVNTSFASAKGFRNSGAPLVQVVDVDDDDDDDDPELYRLVVYEPCSKHINDIGIYGIECSFSVYPYMETLLLLDQPDFMVYNDISKWKAKNKGLLKHKD